MMLPAVKALGDYVCRSQNLSAESMFVEDSRLEGIKNVLCIDFKYHDGKAVYSGIFSKGFNQSESTRYLYRVFSHRRFDVTPTSRMTNPEKLKKRFELWFKLCREEYLQDPLLSVLKTEFLGKINRIFSEFDERFRGLTKEEKQSTLVTISLNGQNHIGDFEIFRRILKNEACSGFFSKHNVESKGKGLCFICKQEKEVLGFASPFPVYTLDQRGFAPNFRQEEAWKRLPICLACAISLSAGKEFLGKYFYKAFYGMNFYAIPSFALKFEDELIDDILNPQRNYLRLVSNEDTISDIMSEKNDQVTLTFIFTKAEKATFRIMRHVEDVPPSWIRQVSSALKELIHPTGPDQMPLFQEKFLRIILGESKLVGNFDEIEDTTLGGLIRPFFPHSKYEGVYDKYFVDTVGEILSQKKIRSSFLIGAFARVLEGTFKRRQDRQTKILALKSLMLILLTSRLGILRDWGQEMQRATGSEGEKADQFFRDYKDAFNSPDKQAVFLEGVLAKFLMDLQFANRKATPFRDRLYGLKLDEKRVKRLFPEIIEKLREYDVAYTSMENLAAKAFVAAENHGWRLTNDELSYFFTLGMTLAPIFKSKGGGE